MNHTYRVVFNESTGTYVAVAEIMPAKGKKSKSSKTAIAAAVAALAGVSAQSQAAVVVGATSATGAVQASGATAAGNSIAIGSGAISRTATNANVNGEIVIGAGARGDHDLGNSAHVWYFNPESSSPSVTQNNTPLAGVRGGTGAVFSSVVVVGQNAKADGGGVAVGDRATVIAQPNAGAADGTEKLRSLGVAIGANAMSRGGGVVIGSSAETQGINSIAVGRQAVAKGEASQAYGVVSAAVGQGSLAMGQSATSRGDRSIAIGMSQSSEQYNSTTNVQANGTDSIAIGSVARSESTNSIAIGKEAKARNYALSLTAAPTAPQNTQSADSIAVGTKATSWGNNTIAIGHNAKTVLNENTQAGQWTGGVGTNHVFYGSPYSSMGKSKQTATSANEVISVTEGDYASRIQSASISIGHDSSASGGGVALGSQATVTRNDSGESRTLGVAIGANSLSRGGGVVVGSSAETRGINAVAVGRQAVAQGSASQAYGVVAAAVGNGSLAMGQSATSLGERSIAIGMSDSSEQYTNTTNVYANGTDSIAMGSVSRSNTNRSVAIGPSAKTLGLANPSTVVNDSGTKRGGSQIAIGDNATTGHINTAGAVTTGQDAIAIGTNASTVQSYDITIGGESKILRNTLENNLKNASVSGRPASVAMGYSAVSQGVHGDTIIGSHARNNMNNQFAIAQSTAIGSRAVVYGDQAMAFGADTSAIGNASVAIGGDDIDKASVALKAAVDSLRTQDMQRLTTIGSRLGTQMGNQTLAANLLYGANVNAVSETARYIRTTAAGDASIAIGATTQALGVGSVAQGVNAITFGNASIAQGVLAHAAGENAIATGSASRTSANHTIAIGHGAKAGGVVTASGVIAADRKGAEAIAIGRDAVASGNQSISVGSGNLVTGDNSGAFGDPSYVTGNGSYSVGNNNTITTDDTFVLGSGANRKADLTTNGTGTVANSVYLGKDSEATAGAAVKTAALTSEQTAGSTTTAGDKGTVANATVGGYLYGGFAGATANGVVTIGASGSERRLQNVAAGEISETSTDAINGSQLYAAMNATARGWDVLNAADDVKGTVTPGDKVKFVGGKGVTVDVATEANNVTTITINSTVEPGTSISNTNLAVNDNGSLVSPPANGDSYVNATSLVEAINKTGWNVTSGVTGTGKQDETPTIEQINPGDAVKLQAGDGLKIKQEGSNFTYSVATGSITSNSTTNKADGNTNNGNIATVGDVVNAVNNVAWTLQENAVEKDDVKAGDVVNFVNGTNTVVNISTATDGNASTIKYDVKVDGTTITNNNGNGLQVANTTLPVEAGNPVQAPSQENATKFVNAGDLATTLNNLGFNVQAEEAEGGKVSGTPEKKAVKTGDTVKFKAGKNIEINQSGQDFTISATVDAAPPENTSLTVADTGNVTTPSQGEGDKLVNATTVANAINESGFNLTANGTNSSRVKAGETVDLNNTDGNIVISKDAANDNVTFNLNNTVKIGDTSSPVSTTNNPITINSTTGKIDGLTANLPDTYNQNSYYNNAADPKKANTPEQKLPENINVKNAATVGDILNAGWNVQENGTARDFVKAYDTVNFVNGTNTIANVSVSDDGTVSSVKYDVKVDGTTITNNNGNGLQVANTTLPVEAGNPVQAPSQENATKFVNAGDLATTLNNLGFNVQAEEAEGGKVSGTPEKKAVKTGDTVKFKAGKNIEINQSGQDFTISATVDAAPPENTSLTVADTGNVTTPSQGEGDKLVNATTVANAINESGFNLTANGTNSSRVKAGETVDLNNTDGNIVISKDAANDNVTFNLNNTVKIGDTSSPVSTTNNPITINSTTGKIDGLTANLPDTYNQNSYYNNSADPKTANTPEQKLPENINVKNAATVGDILNAGWNVQENGTARDFVKAYDTVNFVNGTNTIANVSVSDDGTVSSVKYDVKVDGTTITNNDGNGLQVANTTLPVTPGSTVNKPQGDEAKKFVNAGDLADSLNNLGFNVQAGKDGGETEGKVEKTAVKTGDTVIFNAGNNIAIKQDGQNFTISATVDAAPPTNTSLTVNDAGNVDAPSTDNGGKLVNATTVANAINDSGFKVAANGTITKDGDKDNLVNAGDIIDFANGQGTKANVTVDGNKTIVKFDSPLAYVNSTAPTDTANPTNTVRFVGADSSTPVSVQNVNSGVGSVTNLNTPVGDTATLTPENKKAIADAINKATGNTLSNAVNVGDVQAAAAAAKTEVTSENGTITVTNSTGANGQTIYNVEVATTSLTNNTNGTVAAPTDAKEGDKVVNATTLAEVINKTGWNVTSGVTGTGKQVGDPPKTEQINPGDEVKLQAGDGLRINQDGSTFTYSVATGGITTADNKAVGDTNNGNVATVGDVVNAVNNVAWELQENAVKKDDVKAGDVVNFVNGQGTVVNITSENGVSKIKFDTPLTYVDNAGNQTSAPTNTVNLVGGNTSAPVTLGNLKGADVYTAADAPRNDPATVGLANLTSAPTTQAATVGDLQNMGWVVAAKDGDYAEKVQNADRVEFVGKGVAKVTGETVDNVRTITVEVEEGAMPQQPVVYTNAEGDRVYKQEDGSFNTQEDGQGDKVEAGDVIASMNDGSGNTTAPMVLSNVKSNLVDAPNDGTATSTPADNAPDQLADKKDNAATVGDVLNAGWNLQENGTAKDTVTHADTVNFVNGQGTVVNITSENGVSKIKFDTPLTYVDNAGNQTSAPTSTVNLVGGNTSAPVTLGNLKGADVYTAADAPRNDPATVGLANLTSAPTTQAATVGDLQNMGWVVAAKEGDYAEKVQNADRVEFVGKGVAKVTGETVDNVRTITVEVEEGAMPQQPVVYTNAEGDRVYKQEDGSFNTQEDGQGDKVEAGDVIASMNDGSGNTTAPMVLSNVKSNLVDAPNDGTATSTPADNAPDQLADKKDNAATVGDVLNAGWNLQENGTAKDTVTHADTVNFVNGQGTVVNITSENGVSKIKFDTPLTYVDNAGNQTSAPTNTVNLVGGNTSAPVTLGNLKGADVYTAADAPRNDPATVGLANLTSAPTTQAATVGDLQNMGWVVAAKEGDYAEKVQNADRVEFVGKGVAKVTGETVDNVRTITVEVEEGAMPQQPVVYTNAEGDRVYKQEDGSFNTQEDGQGDKVEAGDVIASMNDGSGNTTAPMVLSNVKSNLVDAPNDGTATSTPADNAPDQLADKKDNAATVGDVLNAGWNLQENGTAKDTVTHADTVNFVNGQGTVVNITSENGVSKIKFDTPLTYVDNAGNQTSAPTNTVNLVGGNTSAPVTLGNLKGADVYTAADAPRNDPATVGLANLTSAPTTQAATVGDLQNMGWVVAAKEGDYAEKVQNADRVEFVGKGVAKVTGETVDNVRTITVEVEEGAMPQQPVVYTNAEGDRVYKQEDGSFNTQEDGQGDKVEAGDVIASMNDGSGNTTAPMVLSNVKSNLVDAPNDGTATSTPADNAPDQLADKKDNAATVGDVLNAGWNLQENGTAKDTVTHADTVNFVNGQGTVVNITSENGVSKVKFDTPLTYVDNAGNQTSAPTNTVNLVGGNTSAPVTLGNLKGADVYTAADAPRNDPATVGLANLTSAPTTQAATVGDLQNMGWVVAAKDGDYAEKVQNADRVEFVGKGVAKVTGETVDNVRTITVEVEEGAMPQQPVVYTNAEGDRVYKQEDGSFNTQEDGQGDKVEAGDVIASMNDGSGNTTAPMVLSNVKSNLVDAPNDGTATSTPADNAPDQLADKKDNAATVGDVLNAGWNLQENGTAKDTVTHADTVNFVNGQGTVVNITSENGVSKIKFDTPLTYVDNAGNQTSAPTNTVNLVGGNTSAPVTLGNLKGADVYTAADAPRNDPATVGLANLTSAPTTQAATVGDLQNMGWVVAAKEGDYAEKVQNADRVEFVGKGVAKVTGETVDNVRTITVEVEEGAMPQQPVVYTNAEGDRVYKQEDGSFNTQEDGQGDKVEAGDVIASMNDGSGNTTAPMVLSNVKSNLVDAPNDGTATSTPADNAPDQLADKKDNAATVGDVLNAGWNLQENGTAKDTVTHADTVNFVNGQGTVVNITSENGVSKVKFDTPLTYVDNAGNQTSAPTNTVNLVGGNTSAPVTLGNLKGADVYTAADAPRNDPATVGLANLTSAPTTQAATVGDLQNMGWVVAAKDGDYAEKVQNADRVEFVGKGVAKVTGETVDNVRTITVEVEEGAMPQQPVVYTNAEGDRVYKQEDGSFNTQEDGQGDKVEAGDVIASMNDGSGNTTAPMVLSNVKSNLVDAPNDGTATSTPADNAPDQLADKKDNAATVGDVLNAGWNLQENGTAKDTVTHADTVNFVNGQGTVVNITSENGVSKIKFDTPLTYVDNAGNQTSAPTNTVNLVGGNTSAPVTLGNLKGADVYTAADAPRNDPATVGLANLTSAPTTQAATVGDLQNMGWVVAAKEGDYAEKVQNADRVEFVGKGVAKVTGETVDNVRTITVEVEEGAMPQQPVVYTNAEGDRVYKQEDGSFNTQEDGQGDKVEAGDVIASMNDGSGNTTAPMVLSNVKSNLVDAPNDGTATSTPADNAPDQLADKKDNAATVGDVLNAGWNLQENGTAKDTVTHADTVNFVNGQGTVVNITSENGVSKIKFDTPLTYVDNAGNQTSAPTNTVNLVGGNTSAPVTLGNLKGADVYTAADAPRNDPATVGLANLTSAPTTQAATVGDLQNMGWVVAAKEGDYAEKVQNADRVEFVGKGVAKVTGETVDNVRTITVEVEEGAMPQQPVVYTNAEGDRVYKQEDGSFNTQEDGQGDKVEAGDVIASMNDGSGNTTAPMVLSNVKSNLVDAPNDGTATSTPADNAPDQLADKKDNAATVGDVLNAGWNLQENGTAKDTVTHADTVNFVNGQGTVVNITSENGVSKIKFDTPLTYVDNAGNQTSAPTNTVNLVGGNTSAPVTLGNLKGADVYTAADAPRNDPATVGLANLTSAPTTQAATVGDLQNMGWVVAAKEGDYAEKVQNADRVEFVGKGVAKVTGETVDNVRTITVEVEEGAMPQQPVVYTNAEGDRVYKQEDGSFNTQEDGQGDKVEAGDVIASMNDGSGNTTAPMVLSNVKSNLVDAPNDGTATSTPADNAPDQLADKKDNAATVGDVLNAGWNLQENGTAKDTVTHADTVNFVNGQGTVVNITSENGVSKVKFDTPLTYVDNAGNQTSAPTNTVNLVGGNTSAPVTLGNLKGADVYTAADAPRNDPATVGLANLTSAPTTQAATVGDLQNMGWVVAAKEGDYAEKVQNADRVEFVGKGVAKVTGETVDNVRTITVEVEEGAMPQQPVVYTNAEGDRVYKQEDGSFNTQEDGQGDKVEAGDVIASMNDGSGNTTAPMVLSNVKSNLVDAPNDGTATSTPADNAPDQLADKKDNAATVGDVLNAGWNLQENGTAKDTVTHADTVNFVNGQGTNVNISTVNGTSTIKFDTPLTYVDAAGNATNAPTNTVNLVGGNASAPVTLGNLKGADVYNTTTAPRPDAVGLTNLTDAPATNAATVGDLQNMGWVVGTPSSNFTNQVKNANRVDFVGTNGATVTGSVNATTGINTITVDVQAQGVTNAAQLPVVYTTNINGVNTPVYLQPDNTFNTAIDGSGSPVDAGDVIASMNSGDNSTVKPTTLNNVKGNLVEAPNDGTATSTPDANSPANLANATNNAATVGDVLNAGWNLQENGTAKDTVTHADTVNFVNGQGTNVNISTVNGTSTIKFDTPLTYVDAAGNATNAPTNTVNLVGGNASAPVTLGNLKGADVYNTTTAPRPDAVGLTNLTDAPATNAATVGDLQNMGWVVGTPSSNFTNQVKNANRVDFVGTNGATVTGSVNATTGINTITVDVQAQGVTNAAQLPVVYTTNINGVNTPVYLQPDNTFNTAIDGSGSPVDAGDVIASMNSGDNSTVKPTTLNNVKGNLVEAPNDGTATSTPDANSPANLANATNNAATVGDVLNAGWNLQENGTAKDTVTHADTVNFVNGQGTNVNISTVNGTSTVKFDTPLTYVDTANNATNVPSNTVSFVGGNTSQPVTVIGVTSGLTPTNTPTMPNGTTSSSNLINFNSPLNSNINPSTVATVGDLRNLGWVVSAAGNNYSDAVKSADQVEFVGEGGVNVTGITKDGKRIITITGGGNGGNVVAGDNVVVNATTVNGPNGTTSSTYNVSAPSVAINANDAGKAQFTNPANTTGLVKAGDVIDTINNVSWNSTAKADPNSTGVASTTGNTSVKAGDTVNFIAGNNMNLTQDGKNLTIATNDNVTFNTMNATNVNVAPNGSLTVASGGNATISMGNNTIQNVKAGDVSVNSTDAVNGSQLYQIYQVVGGDPKQVTEVAPTVNSSTGVTTIAAAPNATVNVINGNVSKAATSNNYTMITYNVEGQKNYITNNVIEAIGRMNEQGIQFFHTNDGTDKLRAIQGENDTDSSASGKWATAIGSRSEAAGEQSIAMGRQSKALGKDSIAIGTGNVVTGQGSGAIGDPSLVTGDASYSLGNNNTLAFDDTFAIGNNIKQTTANSVFLGNKTGYTYASGTDKALINDADTKVIALAQAADVESTLSNQYALAVKTVDELVSPAADAKAKAEAEVSRLKGLWETAQKDLENAQTNATTALDALKANEMKAAEASIATNKGRTAGTSSNLTSQNVAGLTEANKFAGGKEVVGVVSVGVDREVMNTTTNTPEVVHETRRIQNVAPGLLSEQSTDAINGSQLYAVASNLNSQLDEARKVAVNKVTPEMLGNVTFTAPNPDNKVENILFMDGNGTSVNVRNVVGADGKPTTIINVDTTSAYMDVPGSEGKEVKSPTNVVKMLGGVKDADGKNPVSITNVASGVATLNEDGTVTEVPVGNARTAQILNAPADKHNNAVNVGDLYSVGNTLNQKIDEVDDLASAGTAAAMATAGLPQVYLPGKSMVAVAGSTYRGKQGYAVGFSAITDGGNWIVKGSVSGHSKGKFGATVGAGYQW